MFAPSKLAISPSWPLHYSQWSWQATQLWRRGAKRYSREWSASPWSGEEKKKERRKSPAHLSHECKSCFWLGCQAPSPGCCDTGEEQC